MQLTYDFRLEDSPEERARMTASGAILRRLAESGRGPCEAHEVRALLTVALLHCSCTNTNQRCRLPCRWGLARCVYGLGDWR